METPYLPNSVFGEDFEFVYEPAEDTFLLLDALEKDLPTLKDRVFVCLECGSGSGTVITALAKSLPPNILMIGTDINFRACQTSKKCARYHNQSSIQIVNTDLAESLVDRLENKVDLLIFNPPYVPTSINETEANSINKINLSWAGGSDGRQLIDKFLKDYVPRMLSMPDGVVYLVALDKNNIHELLNYYSSTEYNIKGSVVNERKAGIERLSIIKYEWDNVLL